MSAAVLRSIKHTFYKRQLKAPLSFWNVSKFNWKDGENNQSVLYASCFILKVSLWPVLLPLPPELMTHVLHLCLVLVFVFHKEGQPSLNRLGNFVLCFWACDLLAACLVASIWSHFLCDLLLPIGSKTFDLCSLLLHQFVLFIPRFGQRLRNDCLKCAHMEMNEL